MYALAMQCIDGDNLTSRPVPNWWQNIFGGFDYKLQDKWDAWTELTGMDQDTACWDATYLALQVCAEQEADCTNPLYQEWELEWHTCMHEENLG